MFDLTGMTALVTGASGGIGSSIAKALAAQGATLALSGSNEDKLKAFAAELGGDHKTVVCNLSDPASVDALVPQAVEALGGKIDILVNNAGTSVRKRPEDLTEEDWHLVMDTNLTSAFLCSKACYPEMKKAGGGKILNNGSMLSLFGSPWGAAYGSSKGGIMQFTRSQAVAWAEDNIQVNCFLPGWINTELTRQAREYLPELNNKVLARTPAGRWGEPEDLAGLAVFFASPASDFLTGTAVPIDGGFSMSI